MFERLKRALGSAEPDLTWLESEAPQIELPDALHPEEAAERHREAPQGRRFHLEWNAPLFLGALLVLGLFLVVLFGPMLAPENPYLAGQRSSMIVDGAFLTPPFAPMAGIPLGTDQWGRDILSMLLYGTRNTLVACLFIAMARILLGSALGMLAGWNEGGFLDRLVMGLIEWTTALPALLTGMILILALGIQRGITIFIIALCFVGWAEIAQYIRSEFMVVRRKPFIEGARVIGLDGMGIAIRHILPNVLPSLIVIAVLEMGAVLMMLGELGFIGVFIGGGTWVQVGDTAVANIPDIPEWGAMMAGTRQYARNQPWMVFYPALAFFTAVLGFNLLGEGLRRAVQKRGVSTAFILSKRMVLVIAAITLATAYIVTHVGPAPSYAGLAQRFEAAGALSHAAALTAPELEGRQAGTAGGDAAATYIASRFTELGLEPISGASSLRLSMDTEVVSPLSPPRLQLLDALGQPLRSFSYPDDFGLDIRGHGGSGEARGSVALLTFRETSGAPSRAGDVQQFRSLDLRGKIALYLADNAPRDFQVEALIRGATGILLVSDDIVPRLQVADPDADYLLKPRLPVLRIPRAIADALLAADGLSVSRLEELIRGWDHEATWQVRELRTRVEMKVELSAPQGVTSDNVVAILRGSDATLNKQLVVVAAHYDGAGQLPDGAVLQSANEGASAIATMLEILHLWDASGFQPRRTMMFAAWTGGAWEHSGAHEYLTAQAMYSVLETVAVVNLDGLGRGGDELWVEGDAQLMDLLLRSAEASGVPASEGQVQRWPYQLAFDAPTVTIGWADAHIPVREDTLEELDEGKLGQAGQAINLLLITVSREYEY